MSSEITHDASLDVVVALARAGDPGAFQRLVAEHERALLVFAYHLTGSIHEADDVVQEVLLRAWRALASFTGAGSFRGWLRRIASNVVIDRGRAARRRPELVGLPWDPSGDLPPSRDASEWVEPFPDARLATGPEQQLVAVQTLELAFVGLLQRLPARQRAVYVLRELVGASQAETAEWLEMTGDAVGSALTRARATLGKAPSPVPPTDAEHALAERYAAAWGRRDLDGLLALLTDDVAVAMPPYDEWLSGRDAVRTFAIRHLRLPDGPPWRVLTVSASGRPALALYRPDPAGGHAPFGLMLLAPDHARGRPDRVSRLDAFVMPGLFAPFGLPTSL